jgi:large subunit ribosomal protein L30
MAEEKEPKKETAKKYKKIAVIRIRGAVKLNKEIKDTFDMLKLYKQNFCVVLDDSPSIKGMLKKIEGYVAWGEIDEETLKLLKGKKKFFRMHPPRKGFERKGIKIPFSKGGAVGYRGDKINDLIKRMLPD